MNDNRFHSDCRIAGAQCIEQHLMKQCDVASACVVMLDAAQN